MPSIVKEEFVINAEKHGRPILADLCLSDGGDLKPVVIFAHGFKGFKDWGHFNLVEERFAKAGFAFLKFNFSHNGTTLQSPADFADLEAFGHNNLGIELYDLGAVIDWVERSEELRSRCDTGRIYLMGHSRGGGIAIIRASEDRRVKKLLTWSAVGGFDRYLKIKPEHAWRSDGVVFVKNSRTNQDMPMYYQFLDDYLAHRERYHVRKCASKLAIPTLFIHGTADEAVPFSDAQALHKACKGSRLLPVEGGGHTFGATHPWEGNRLPDMAEQVVLESIDFFRS